MRFVSSRFLYGLLGLFLTLSPAEAQVPVDFDRDGTSDVITVSGSPDLTWKGKLSSGTDFSQVFGVAGDILTPGLWTSTTQPSLGVVHQDPSTNKLVWKIPNGSQIVPSTWGKAGDYVLSSADFDGNGIHDAAIMTIKNGQYHWKIKLNIFSATPAVRRFVFGTDGERIFYLNPDGGNDWLATIGRNTKKKRTEVKLRDVTTKRKRTLGGFPASLSRNPRPRPIPLRKSDGIDALVFVTDDAADSTISAYGLDGKLINATSAQGRGEAFTGDFRPDDPGEEVAFLTPSKFIYYNPFSNTVYDLALTSGTPIDFFTVTQATPPVGTTQAE